MKKHDNQKLPNAGNEQTFSVVRFRDAGDTYCFTTHENTFFEISNTYYQTVRDDVGKYTLDSLGDSYWERNYIPEEVFLALCEVQ